MTETYNPVPCVERGAELLTETIGNTMWMQHIVLGFLDMDAYDGCILGQTFGTYGRGMKRLFQLDPDDDDSEAKANRLAEEHGFIAPGYGDTYHMNSHVLEEAWKTYINEQISREEVLHVL